MPWVSATRSMRWILSLGVPGVLRSRPVETGCGAVDLDYCCFNSWNDGDQSLVMGVGSPRDVFSHREQWLRPAMGQTGMGGSRIGWCG
jgi:hypothetical protein